jgi:hypothetical protein
MEFEITPSLRAALDRFCGMKAPSVARILRGHRYEYEAGVCEDLVIAWEEYKRLEQSRKTD